MTVRRYSRPVLRAGYSAVNARYPAATAGLRTAYRAYQLARKYRRPIKATARVAFKIAKRQKRRMFTLPNQWSGPKPAKRTRHADDARVLKSTRQLYTRALVNDIPGLTATPGITSGAELNRRLSNTIKLSGMKICFTVRNVSTKPLWFHFAVVNLKQENTSISENMFRSQGTAVDATENAVDFNHLTLSGMDMHCLPLNSDKFHILKHMKMEIMPDATTTATDYTNNSAKNYKFVDFYLDIKKNIRFRDSTDTTPESTDLYTIFWATHFGDAKGAAIATNQYEIQERVVTYFRDKK